MANTLVQAHNINSITTEELYFPATHTTPEFYAVNVVATDADGNEIKLTLFTKERVSIEALPNRVAFK